MNEAHELISLVEQANAHVVEASISSGTFTDVQRLNFHGEKIPGGNYTQVRLELLIPIKD